MRVECSAGDPTPSALQDIDGLVPSDFALVARRVAFGGDGAPDALMAMLTAEAGEVPGRNCRVTHR